MDMTPYFRLMADKEASDMFFCTGTEPHIKIQGVIRPVGTQRLAPGDVREMAYSMMNEEQAALFEDTLEMNFAVPLKGVGRFRVNIFRQRGECSIVIRYIQTKIPRFEEMNLPASLGDIIMEKRGLVLVVGATGSGKSTTLASMIGHRNEKYEDFGKVAARLDDVVNLIPARLTGVIFAICGGQFTRAWAVIRADAAKHRSPNAGWPEGALAGSLNIRLSGPR